MGEQIENRYGWKQDPSRSFKEQKRPASTVFASLLLSVSFLFSPQVNAQSEKGICPKGSSLYSFTLEPGQKCRGEKYGNICAECRTPSGYAINTSIENMQEKIDSGLKNSNVKGIGKKFDYKDIHIIKEKLKKWDKNELEKLIKKLNGNLSDEERKIFMGALEHWPEIKYHSMRLGIDPRIPYLVAIAESRMVQKKGNSGEVSPMQIMPSTMVLMYNMYGKNDPYIIDLKKQGQDWRKDKTAQIVLALYYLRDGISTVAKPDTRIERISPQNLLMIYHFYNRGQNNYFVDNWWQGDNFATSTEKYLKLYLEIEKFIDEFMKRDESYKSMIKETKLISQTHNISNAHKKQAQSSQSSSLEAKSNEIKKSDIKQPKAEGIMKKGAESDHNKKQKTIQANDKKESEKAKTNKTADENDKDKKDKNTKEIENDYDQQLKLIKETIERIDKRIKELEKLKSKQE